MSVRIVFNQIPEFLVITYAHHITVDNLLNMYEVSGKLKNWTHWISLLLIWKILTIKNKFKFSPKQSRPKKYF